VKINKKIIFLSLLTIVLVPSLCFAQAAAGQPTDFKTIINNVATQLKGIGAGLATIAFIVAGVMFLSATGNPSRMTIAKGALIAGVIGIVIILLSSGACNFINTLTGAGGSCV
jgi:type IV secretory pathway VirB2 component (pilin)